MNIGDQIEEMAQAILEAGDNYDTCLEEDCITIAELIYNKGYRKASDVAEEIFAEISKASADWGCYCISAFKWGYVTSDVSRTLAELKKKYIGKDTNVTTNTEEGK